MVQGETSNTVSVFLSLHPVLRKDMDDIGGVTLRASVHLSVALHSAKHC